MTVDDLHLLRLDDIEYVQELLEMYADMDVPREHFEIFKINLLQRVDSWFVEASNIGLIYLTNIVPGFTANFHVIFWDKRFGANRREIVRNVLATAFSEFFLTRITALVPETNVPLAYTELKKIGFKHEGVMRKGWREVVDVDCVVYGLLKTEAVEWQPVDHLMTSSAPRT